MLLSIAAVKYWMAEWGEQPHDEPMYLRLPVGVDTRGWAPMHEGFTDYLRGQKNWNRPTKEHYETDYEFTESFGGSSDASGTYALSLMAAVTEKLSVSSSAEKTRDTLTDVFSSQSL